MISSHVIHIDPSRGLCDTGDHGNGRLKPEADLGVEAYVHVRALRVESSRSAGVNVRLVERLQQPHEVGAVGLRRGGQEVVSDGAGEVGGAKASHSPPDSSPPGGSAPRAP